MGASGSGQPWGPVVGAGAAGWAEATATTVGSWLHGDGWYPLRRPHIEADLTPGEHANVPEPACLRGRRRRAHRRDAFLGNARYGLRAVLAEAEGATTT